MNENEITTGHNLTDIHTNTNASFQQPKEIIVESKEKERDYEEYEKILKSDAPKERWKRDNDRRMFQYLRDYCKESGDKLENIHQKLNDDPEGQLAFWSTVAHKLSWRGPVATLQKRFKMVSQLKGISIREEILLK